MNNGEMKIGELCKELGVSSRSYNTFMGQNGKYKGENTATYPAAFRFFKAREARGIKTTAKRVKKSEEKKVDLSGIHLDGEETTSVPVFDTCDEVRRKINAYLRGPGVTQAAFLREAVKTYPDGGKKISSKQLTDFLSKKGPSAGNTSAAFYASYVFFEKLRIKDDKPKSKHRLEMEKRHRGGFDVTYPSHNGYLCKAGERPHEDVYGTVTFS
jgi:hypothetical protein